MIGFFDSISFCIPDEEDNPSENIENRSYHKKFKYREWEERGNMTKNNRVKTDDCSGVRFTEISVIPGYNEENENS